MSIRKRLTGNAIADVPPALDRILMDVLSQYQLEPSTAYYDLLDGLVLTVLIQGSSRWDRDQRSTFEDALERAARQAGYSNVSVISYYDRRAGSKYLVVEITQRL